MPKLTFEIEILEHADSIITDEDKKSVRRELQKVENYLNSGDDEVKYCKVTEIGELQPKKQSKEMYYKSLWNKYFAEATMLGDNEFADLALIMSEQINKEHKRRIEQNRINDAKMKGVIIN